MNDISATGRQLEAILPKERIRARLIDLVSYASDAGFYYLRPQAVVLPVDEKEIQAIFQFSARHKIPVCFRAGGTSLSGQSVTDGILVDLSQYWPSAKVLEQGKFVSVQPGITGAKVNGILKKYGRKIGPDPSSINAAMMGGILSNNASGMCCGVQHNSYHTTRFIKFILPNGQLFSTADSSDYARFEQECPDLYATIEQLRVQVTGSAQLSQRIRQKYLTKNTVGYSLNSFIDYTHPLDILAHLLIGGEGTLAFIAEATMETLPDLPFKSTGLLFFPDIFAACKAIVPLTQIGAEAVELMDRASLRSIQHLAGVPKEIAALPADAAALLIEFQGTQREEVDNKLTFFLEMSKTLSLLAIPAFTDDADEQAFLWKLRKGMFPAVGAVRNAGTTVILEDIAFPVEALGDAVLDLHQLFAKYEYDDAIIFGHAKDGNLHFVITQTFNTATETTRYQRFIDDVVELVVKKYDGALKAEHGTGRNMAPFVETEWGAEAYGIMKALKNAVDPLQLLNPGVIINADKHAHLRNLKPLPVVEAEVDKCIECGFCEPICPSRNITLTPRRRIVVRREMALLREADHHTLFKKLNHQYQYDGLDTCAVDGLCAGECPVAINTGDLVKRLRAEQHGRLGIWLSKKAVRYFGTLTAVVRSLLAVASGINRIFGKRTMSKITKGIRTIIPAFPLWSDGIHASKKGRPGLYHATAADAKKIVYFSSCITRMMGGAADGKKNLADTFQRVAAKAGISVIVPAPINSLCCGQIFSSKGFKEANAQMANTAIAALWQATEKGTWPVVLDVTSCTQNLLQCRYMLSNEHQHFFDNMNIIDSIAFLADEVLNANIAVHKKNSITLHPVCSVQKMGLHKKLLKIANHFANEVHVPVNKGCCGMAGDRGFLFPELVQSATKAEVAEVLQNACDGYYSSAKTCEMAMTEYSGKQYESLLYLADETTE